MAWYLEAITETPKKYPNPKFMYAYVALPGGKPLKPGNYKIKKGTTVTFSFGIKNQGGYGACRIKVFDMLTGNAVYDHTVNLNSGKTYSAMFHVNLNRTMKIKFETYYLKGMSWIKTDERGC